MKHTKANRSSANKYEKPRDVTPQPQKQQEPVARMNLTPLRSNIKKTSAVKSSKKVVIQDPTFQLRVRDMLQNIQQFFIKKILRYQQEGFDAIHQPYQDALEKEQQITHNHNMLIQRHALSEWLKSFTRQKRAKQVPKRQQKKLTPFEHDEGTLQTLVDAQRTRHVMASIFGVWKRDFNESRYNVALKNSSIKDNLSRFLKDMSEAVKEAKEPTQQDLELREAIVRYKIYLPQRVLKQKLKKKPYATPSAKKPTHNPKTSLSFQKESQSNLLGRGNERINRILFTELSPNNGTQRSGQIKKNLSAQKFHHNEQQHKRCPSQPTMLKILQAKPAPRRYQAEDVTRMVNSLQGLLQQRLTGMFQNRRDELYIINKFINRLLTAQRNENLKRKVIFNWKRVIPELQVERFQERFRAQKLVKVEINLTSKAIRNPFFKLLKQRANSPPAVDRISHFLESASGKRTKKK